MAKNTATPHTAEAIIEELQASVADLFNKAAIARDAAQDATTAANELNKRLLVIRAELARRELAGLRGESPE